MQTRGKLRFVVRNFFDSQYQKTLKIALLCFSKNLVSKNFVHRRGLSRFSVRNFMSHCGDKGRRGALLYFRMFLVSKDFLDIWGGYHKIPLKVLVSDYWRLSLRNFSVFQNYFRIENFYAYEADITFSVGDISSQSTEILRRGTILFCRKKFGIEKIYAQEGDITFLRRN